MKVLRYIIQVLVGVFFAFLTLASLSPLFVSFQSTTGTTLAIIVGVIVIIFASIAPSIRRCFGRSFLILGAAIFLLPISAVVLSGVALNETVEMAADADKSSAIVGGVLAGGLVTGLASFVGFVLGTILLVFGLVLSLGGTREVTIKGRR